MHRWRRCTLSIIRPADPPNLERRPRPALSFRILSANSPGSQPFAGGSRRERPTCPRRFYRGDHRCDRRLLVFGAFGLRTGQQFGQSFGATQSVGATDADE